MPDPGKKNICGANLNLLDSKEEFKDSGPSPRLPWEEKNEERAMGGTARPKTEKPDVNAGGGASVFFGGGLGED